MQGLGQLHMQVGRESRELHSSVRWVVCGDSHLLVAVGVGRQKDSLGLHASSQLASPAPARV